MFDSISDYTPYLLVAGAILLAGLIFFLARRKGNC
jgi:LPXTG-motif cell wall-anchored protein